MEYWTTLYLVVCSCFLIIPVTRRHTPTVSFIWGTIHGHIVKVIRKVHAQKLTHICFPLKINLNGNSENRNGVCVCVEGFSWPLLWWRYAFLLLHSLLYSLYLYIHTKATGSIHHRHKQQKRTKLTLSVGSISISICRCWIKVWVVSVN